MIKIKVPEPRVLEGGIMFLLLLYIFFPFKFIYSNKMIILIISSALLLVVSIKYTDFWRIKLKKYAWITILFIYLILNSLRFSFNDDVTKELMIFAFAIYILIAASVDKYLYKTMLRGCYVFSFVSQMSILLQILFPNMILTIIQTVMDPDAYSSAVLAYEINGYYVGFLCYNSLSAFFSSFIVGVEFTKIFQHSKSNINNKFINEDTMKSIVYIIIAIAAIMASGKRGVLFSSIIAIGAILFFVSGKKSKIHKKRSIWLVMISIFVVAYFLLNTLPSLQFIYNRIFNNDNFFSDRIDLYYIPLLIGIRDSILFGHGVASTGNLIHNGSAHNIYIQILYEDGVVGLFLYGAFFISSIIYTVKKYKTFVEKQAPSDYIFSLYIQIVFLFYGMTGNPLYVSGLLITYLFSMSPGYRMRKW